ncbi:MAG TPA: anti-sigma factor [Candidatus Acidoferrales bacterium]|jgi:anti-sigma-K factor RskA|nr:anti-sigma factor [Candidatus Acidoferrales bacterium]
MIDERMEEQASLHVLGALTPEEAAQFKATMAADPELQAYVARLSVATGALAGSVPAAEPPPQLRAKILAQVAEKQKIVTLPERTVRPFLWWGWSLAFGLGVVLVVLNLHVQPLREKVAVQARQITDLNQLVQTLEAATNNLQQTVLALQETNRLAGLRIAMLSSLLTDSPKAVAVSLWDDTKQEGVFVVQNLKPLPADRDYQLWVLDNGTTPVDAGIFRVDEKGNVRVEFKTKSLIKVAGKFAVTEEAKGGVASPTLKNMVLLGG